MFLLNLGTQDPKPQIDQVGGIIFISEKSKFVKELQVYFFKVTITIMTTLLANYFGRWYPGIPKSFSPINFVVYDSPRCHMISWP